jgi:hypothetical protein
MYDYVIAIELATSRYEELVQQAMQKRRALRVPARSRLLQLIKTLTFVLF